jgi:hypothetical protein
MLNPSGGASIMSSIAGSTLPASSNSSDSATHAAPLPILHTPTIVQSPAVPAPAPANVPPVLPITIKDKPSDMGIKPITDKDTWMNTKKIISTRLQRAPYWPGELKELVSTDANAATSVWWEEVIAYYCQPPVSDLFVEECCFDGRGFEVIAHINQHFNPSGAVDSLAYIFNLINIRQTDQESVVTLKARFSRLFTALKMGGINIDSALQVRFMLQALLSKYQAVV